MNARPAILALLLVVSSLTVTPTAQAQTGVGYVEGFEGLPLGVPPSSSWFSSYDSTSANGPTGAVTVAATTLTGSQRALAFTPGTTNSYAAVVGQSRDLDLCTTNAGFSFDVYLPAMASGQQLEFLVKGGTFNLATGTNVPDRYDWRSVGFQVRGTGTAGSTVTPFHDGFFGTSAGPGIPLGTVTTPGLFHVSITNQVCTSIQTRFTFTWGSLATSLTRNQALTSILNNFYIHADGAPYATTYVDNLAWSGLNHYTHGPNYEDFRNYTLGTRPSKPFYQFTENKGTGPAYPGVLDCIGLASVSAQLASRCAYVPPATTQTFRSLSGEFCPVQQDPTGTAQLQSKLGFDFAIGQGAWANNGQTKIQLLDNLTAPRNSITLEGVRVSDGSMAPHILIVANGVTVDDHTYVNAFNQFQDHFGIICKSVPGASGSHTDSVELRSDSHQGFTYTRTITATDAVQGIFTAPLVYLVVGNLACNSCGGIQVDNLDFPNSLAASVSVSLPGLVGFSADAFDQSVIVRRTGTGGQDVQTLDPGNLHISGTFHEANCNRLGGVATRYAGGKVSTSFVDCDTGNNVNQLHIRNENLGPPDFTGTPCEGESFCDTDISGPFGASGASAPPSNARDVGSMESAPWDYSLGSVESDCLLCVKHATLAWAYSEITMSPSSPSPPCSRAEAGSTTPSASGVPGTASSSSPVMATPSSPTSSARNSGHGMPPARCSTAQA
ncbi:MAG: hypothetical protein LC623_02280 [Halobacteriales archaeon]|nr:hypothetical protein [Halobacteriales archaeon]